MKLSQLRRLAHHLQIRLLREQIIQENKKAERCRKLGIRCKNKAGMYQKELDYLVPRYEERTDTFPREPLPIHFTGEMI